jgi:hypothetical protein
LYLLSASSVAAFKACPTRFRLAYREGLRLAEDTESQRVGTNWHQMHECYANALADRETLEGCSLEAKNDYALACVVDLLNDRYVLHCPNYKTAFEWALERQVLLTCFIGYLWYYTNDPVEFLASEVPFELPLHSPRTGLPLSTDEVLRVGKIDHVIRWQGMVGALERKSTSRSIDPASDYWDKSKKDTQVSMYALAFKDMVNADPMRDPFGADCDRFGTTLYDVWHKPTIKPKMLTQAETREFAWGETKGRYCGQSFNVETVNQDDTPDLVARVIVDGEQCEVEHGKKGFAIRETVGMFGARLLADIYERPDFYFVRREIVRTDAEIQHFRKQLYAVYQSQRLMEKHGTWFENEQQCRATFPCPYIPICYGPGSTSVCDGKTTPPNFKRIFVDLTVNGQEAEE